MVNVWFDTHHKFQKKVDQKSGPKKVISTRGTSHPLIL